MIRIGYAPGAYDLFHIGHLNLLRRARESCDYLIAGVVSDDVLIEHKGVTPVIPLAERLEIVRNVRFVDAAHVAMTGDKVEIWNDLRFNVLFKGDDWHGTEKRNKLERDFSALGVEVVFPSLYAVGIEQYPTQYLAQYRHAGHASPIGRIQSCDLIDDLPPFNSLANRRCGSCRRRR